MSDPRSGANPAVETLPWRRRRTRHTAGFLSPAVRNAAATRQVDPRALDGSGSNGRVTVADVVTARDAGAHDEVVPFNAVRKRGAKALLESKRTAAHAFTAVAADYARIDAARGERRLTALPFVARAVVDALREFPHLNANVDGDALVVSNAVHLGIAVDLDHQGLVVPVVRDAGRMSLLELAAGIRDLAARARARRLVPDDVAGGTFTITNPGAAGTWISVPIINAPQVGILSTDGVHKRLVVDDGGGLRVRPVGHLCLSFDHRAVDDAYAGAFVDRVRDIVEHRDWAAER